MTNCKNDATQKQLEMKRARKREIKARSRARQTKAQRDEENAKARMRMAKYYSSEEARAVKRAKSRESMAKRRQSMTEKEREEVKRRDCERRRKKREAEIRDGLYDHATVAKGTEEKKGTSCAQDQGGHDSEMKMASATTSTPNAKDRDDEVVDGYMIEDETSMSTTTNTTNTKKGDTTFNGHNVSTTATFETQNSAVGSARITSNGSGTVDEMVHALFIEIDDPMLDSFCSKFGATE